MIRRNDMNLEKSRRSRQSSESLSRRPHRWLITVFADGRASLQSAQPGMNKTGAFNLHDTPIEVVQGTL
jgi:hypothetical protein